MKSKILDKDKGYKDLVKRVFKGRKASISVGILEKDANELHKETPGHVTQALTVLEVAIINEFGYGVPERSFIRAWFDENEHKCKEILTRLLTSVVEGKRTKEQALELAGQVFVAQIQKRISAGIEPANAESTIRQKGSDKPLVNTGQLRSSVSYKTEIKE